MSESPAFRTLLLPGLLMGLVGWGGLAALVLLVEPLVWMRWAFFALLFVALTGTSLPLVYLLNRWFPSEPPCTHRVLLRRSHWVAVYGLVVLWLRWGDLLNLWLALSLAAGLIALEWLLGLRESSLWRPPASTGTNAPTEANTHDRAA